MDGNIYRDSALISEDRLRIHYVSTAYSPSPAWPCVPWEARVEGYEAAHPHSRIQQQPPGLGAWQASEFGLVPSPWRITAPRFDLPGQTSHARGHEVPSRPRRGRRGRWVGSRIRSDPLPTLGAIGIWSIGFED